MPSVSRFLICSAAPCTISEPGRDRLKTEVLKYLSEMNVLKRGFISADAVVSPSRRSWKIGGVETKSDRLSVEEGLHVSAWLR